MPGKPARGRTCFDFQAFLAPQHPPALWNGSFQAGSWGRAWAGGWSPTGWTDPAPQSFLHHYGIIRNWRSSGYQGEPASKTLFFYYYFIFSNVIFPLLVPGCFAAGAADGLEKTWELGAGGAHPCSPGEGLEAQSTANRKNNLTENQAALDQQSTAP